MKCLKYDSHSSMSKIFLYQKSMTKFHLSTQMTTVKGKPFAI